MPPGADREKWSRSPLQGVLLALLLAERERPLHGYRLATMAIRRLGPAWALSRQSVYGALSGLEKEGLVSAEERSATRGGRGHEQRVYRATERGANAHAAWMEASVGKEPVRVELQARIAVSRAEDAPRLLRALDAYERSCFLVLRETQGAEVPMGSWAGLSMNLRRTAVDESIQAELRWVAQARKWINDYVAEHPSEAAR